MQRRHLFTLGLCLPFVGCQSPSTVPLELDFGYADVSKLEIFTYPFASPPRNVTKMEVDRIEMARWVGYFTDLPISPAQQFDKSQLPGCVTDGYRFTLRDGTKYEVTHIFIGPSSSLGHGNLLVWPDGRTAWSAYGAPSGLIGAPVSATEAPVVALT